MYLPWFLFALVMVSLGIFFIGRRLIRPMKLRSPWNFIAWSVLVILFLLPIASFIFMRTSDGVGEFYSWISYLGLGFLSFVFTFLLMRDIGSVVTTAFLKIRSLFPSKQKPVEQSRREFLLQSTNVGIVAAAGVLTTYGIYEARRSPGIVNLEIPLKNLPKEFEGFKIAQITDIHAGLTVRRDWVEKIVHETQALSPDLIAFTGDMADGSVPYLENDVAPLGELKAPYGKFFTTGNHEYYSGAPQWIKHAGALGYDVLMNEHRTIEKNGASIVFAGVTDYTAGQFFKDQASDPRKAVEQSPDGLVKILMAHQPKSLYQTEGLNIDLILSGHTHGGQFFPWNLVATLGQPYIKGLHKHNDSWIYVSKGTGYWGPPVRLGARSEITVLTLKSMQEL